MLTRQDAIARHLSPVQRISMSMSPTIDLRLLRRTSSGLLDGLSECECRIIASCAKEYSFARDELFFAQGEPVENLVLLRSGTVKHTQVSSNGNVAILHISCGGGVLTFQEPSSHLEHACTVRAIERCRALVWDYRHIQRLFLSYPRLRTNFDRVVIAQLEELERRFCEMATESAPRRLARALIRLHKQIGKNRNPPVILSLSREELAQMTGATVFTVSRLLSRWSELGLLVAGRMEIVLKDEGRLELMDENELSENRFDGPHLMTPMELASLEN